MTIHELKTIQKGPDYYQWLTAYFNQLLGCRDQITGSKNIQDELEDENEGQIRIRDIIAIITFLNQNEVKNKYQLINDLEINLIQAIDQELIDIEKELEFVNEGFKREGYKETKQDKDSELNTSFSI